MGKLNDLEKGLPIADRQLIFQCLKTDISETMMRYFGEKEAGYPSFHSCGFTDDQIRLFWEEVYYEKVRKINQIMARNERPPLFSDPSDSFVSAKEYFELME